jgi:hypothetical protein
MSNLKDALVQHEWTHKGPHSKKACSYALVQLREDVAAICVQLAHHCNPEWNMTTFWLWNESVQPCRVAVTIQRK